MKITVIGAGNMGGALVKGWAKAGLSSDLTVTARSQETLDRLVEACPGITTMLDNKQATKGADVVLLAVKPWLIEQVIEEIKPELADKLLISVAANVRHERINVYAMPNIAVEFGESMTFIEEAPQANVACRALWKVGTKQDCSAEIDGSGHDDGRLRHCLCHAFPACYDGRRSRDGLLSR